MNGFTEQAEDAITIFEAAVERATPVPELYAGVDDVHSLHSEVFVVGVGKAAMSMSSALERVVSVAGGIITVPRGYVTSRMADRFTPAHVEVIEGDHPLPGELSDNSVRKTRSFIGALPSGAVVIVPISGGGSSLWGQPIEGIDPVQYRSIVESLMASGLDIGRINLVRRHLNRLGGGGLLSLVHAFTVCGIVVSDVPGDNLSIVSSGPLSPPDTGELESCTELFRKMVDSEMLPRRVAEHLIQRLQSKLEANLEQVPLHCIASNAHALQAAGKRARRLGYRVIYWDEALTGESKHCAVRFVQQLEVLNGGEPFCLLAGGETTVSLTGSGRGGRNQEFALAAAIELSKREIGATVLAAGSDGVDGQTSAAGGVVDSKTVSARAAQGRSAKVYLQNNDSYSYFKDTRNHVITGPTHTNVMDIVIAVKKP